MEIKYLLAINRLNTNLHKLVLTERLSSFIWSPSCGRRSLYIGSQVCLRRSRNLRVGNGCCVCPDNFIAN